MNRCWVIALATVAFCLPPAGSLPLRAAAGQGMGRGNMPTPGSLFKKNERERDVVGLSLAATDEPVLDVRIVGNRLIPTSQILNEMQTRVGRPYDPTLVQRDVRKLTSRSWFVAVEPTIEQTPTGRIVTIRVVERPTIRYIEYLGNQNIRDKKLAKETGLKLGGSVDPYAVEEARRKIIAMYQRNGFNETQVTVMEGNKATDQGIVYVINEGMKQKVWKVRFEGNKFVSDGRLKTQIESKPPLMLVFKGYVDRDQVDGDVRRLTEYYRAFGFFKAKVGRKLEYNEKGNWVTLRFVIDEGPRYDVRNVSYMGNQVFANSSLEMGMEMPAGLPFEQAKMNKDVRWLKTLYGSQGYVFADIKAEPVFLEEPGKIDLVYHIEEGRQWRVGRIFVHIDGENPHTRIQTALNRLSIHPGQIVDIREIHASERRLQASSLFLTDPARGVSPKITYRIQELDDIDLASGPDGEGIRGQSPDGAPSVYHRHSHSSPTTTAYEIPLPAGYLPSDDAIDIHLEIERPEPNSTTVHRPATENAPPVDHSAAGAHQTLVIRTQSPYQPATTTTASGTPNYPAAAPIQAAQAYAATAYGGSNAYGGLAVGATGPDAAPVGHNAQAVSAVQPAQYGELIPAPSGAFGPPPLGPPPTAGQPQVVGPPVAMPNQVITPIPQDPRLFPSGMPQPWAQTFDDPVVDIFVDTSEAQTGRLLLGVAVNSDAGLTGQILLDEQNFDWRRWPRSMEDVVSGRALRGAGQRFRLEAMPGTQVQRYIASFQEPYLWDTPISFGLSGSFYDRRFEDWSEQRLGGRVSLGYQWTENDVSAALAYRGENVNIYDPIVTNPDDDGPPELAEVIGDNILHGFKLTLANDTRDSAFFATSGHYAELSFEQVVGSFIYPRAMLDLRQYGLISERPDHSGRQVLSFATQLGFTGSNTPIYDTFYAGGITFRGFEYHSVSPKKFSDTGADVEIGGQFMWINSLEYLYPITADDMMHGVVFVDYGTVEENITIDFDRFRVAPGFGLRLTIPAMGPAPIALDFAFPIAEASTDNRQVFTFNIGFNR
jgi:outer membrane protein insertion porin family